MEADLFQGAAWRTYVALVVKLVLFCMLSSFGVATLQTPYRF